jgi:ribosome-binding protein aMBF1 (putative translation factor)
LVFGGTINILTKKNRRFLKIRDLTRKLGEVVEDGIEDRGLSQGGLTTKNKIIRKRRERLGG